jgi:bifunctional oligoribonuclease and PAP phosphatase NrnA
LIQPFLDLIGSQRRFLLSGHTNPDGDCLGAQVALYHLLEAKGAQAHILNPDPLPGNLARLLKDTPISDYRSSQDLPDFDVLVLLDCAHLSRLGDLGQRLGEKKPKIAVIDHHVGSENGDGDVNLVDSDAPATGALVHDLYEALGMQPSRLAAEGVFLSLVSDTGWFRYSNTDARTLTLAAKLVGAGVRPDHVFDELYRRCDPRSVAFLSSALASHEFRLNQRFVLAKLDRSAMEQAGRIHFDTDQLLEPIRSVTGVEVAALFKELYSGDVKLSLRATGAVDVQAIASVFGGGGHRKAAGATLKMPMTECVDAVEREVSKALDGQGRAT